MTDLREVWDEVSKRLVEAGHLLILLDYDGILVPIADRPELSMLSLEGQEVLGKVRDLPRVSVGVVSGRTLSDLAFHVSVDGLWYIGNHGYELRSPAGAETRFYEPEDVRELDVVREEIARETAHIPGIRLEPKGPILAVHFRQVEPSRIGEVERVFLAVVERHRDRVQVEHGKAVLEARLRAPCTKASAVRYIRRKSPTGALPLYFGDDLTDNDAFRELRDVGITVAVGNPDPPLAHYTLPDCGAVLETLRRITAKERQS